MAHHHVLAVVRGIDTGSYAGRSLQVADLAGRRCYRVWPREGVPTATVFVTRLLETEGILRS